MRSGLLLPASRPEEGGEEEKGGKGSRRALLIRQARWNTREENPDRSQRQAGISKGRAAGDAGRRTQQQKK